MYTKQNAPVVLLAFSAFLTLCSAIAFIVYAQYWPRNDGATPIEVVKSTIPLIAISFVLLAVAAIGYRLAQCHGDTNRVIGIGSLWIGALGMLVGSASHAMGPFYLPSALTLLAMSVLITRNAMYGPKA